MKKFNIFKIVQLSLLILITLISVYLLMQPEVKQYIFASTPATILFIIIWIVLLASYVFLLIDFSILSSVKLNYHNLYGVAYSDPLSGIPNRFSCDTIIEKYYDTTLPDNLTCVMIDLSNLSSVNKLYDHATGNMLLKDFSNILSASALSLCFVGRNGGNEFLMIVNHGSHDTMEYFIESLNQQLKEYNEEHSNAPIQIQYAYILNEEAHAEYFSTLLTETYNKLHP